MLFAYTFSFNLILIGSQTIPCSLVQNLSKEKKKRNGKIVVGVKKRLRLKYKNFIF